MSRISRTEWAIGVALKTAERSTCLRRAVGCVLLDERAQVMSTGYNGRASGLDHCSDGHPCSGATSPSGTNLDGCEAIHAEQNALLQCHDVWAARTCFVTASPCVTCVKLLLNTGVVTIVFRDEYPHPEAKQLWVKAQRAWIRVGADGTVTDG